MVAGNTEQATAAVMYCRVAAVDTAVVGDGGRVRVAFSAAGCLVVAAVAVGGGGAVVACTGVWQCRRVSWTVLFDVCVYITNGMYIYK